MNNPVSTRPVVYHIPVCPFSQRLEILLALKGQTGAVDFKFVDVTKPRDTGLLSKTNGTTALPVLETPDGHIVKESLIILDYLDATITGGQLRRLDPLEHAIERMLIATETTFTMTGYLYVMNQDRSARDNHHEKLLGIYRSINDFLIRQATPGPFLFDDFGLVETVYTPLFKRFWFLDYYEGFSLPEESDYARVAEWHSACMAHPATQQVTKEEIVKLYYDYALGFGNGALPMGRTISSFSMQPRWQDRPWPPADKYETAATDAELGLS